MKFLSIWEERPAHEFWNAHLLGNGRLGFSVYGTVPKEEILVNDDTLWSGHEDYYVNPRHYEKFKEAQQLALECKVKEANEVINNEMTGRWSEAYLPLGSIYLMTGQADNVRTMTLKTIVEAPESAFTEYRRELDLSTAVETVSYQKNGIRYDREYFVSKPREAGFIYLSAEDLSGQKEKPLCFAIGVDSKLHYENGANEEAAFLTGVAPSHAEPSYTPVAPMLIYEKESESKALRYGLVVKVLATDGETGTDYQRTYVRNASYAILAVTAKTNFTGLHVPRNNDRTQLLEELMAQTETLEGIDYQELKAEHIADYQSLFNRVEIDLGTPLTEKLPTTKRFDLGARGIDDPSLAVLYMQYARYLTIAGSRPGTQPLNLQGIWNDLVNAPWASNYTTNINVEMNYWPAEILGLPECHLPLMDMLTELCENCQQVARDYYHMSGWTAHHNVDLWRSGEPSCEDASWSWWPFGGIWMCQHIWTHYEFTQDLDFLKKMFPVLEQQAAFMIDFLTKDQNGYYVTAPSISPENKFIWNGGEDVLISMIEEAASGSRGSSIDPNISAVTVASTMDMSMIRELFINVDQARRLLGMESDIARRAMEIMPQMYPYEIGQKGELLEWHEEVPEPSPGMGHISHMYPVYPGNLFTENQNRVLFEAARRSLERRQLNTAFSGGWPGAWRIALMARFRNPLECGHIIKSGGRIFGANMVSQRSQQMDGIFGMGAGIAEMLLQSHQGFIELLPAITVDWYQGSFRGLRARGGFELSAEWKESRLISGSIKSLAGKEAVVQAPGLQYVMDENGTVLSSAENDRIAFETEAGKEYRLIFDEKAVTRRKVAAVEY